jgi:taurine dioxygenase
VSHHPVVRVHPETGEKALYVNPLFTSRILDVSAGESEWILDFLFRHIFQPEFTMRFRWQPGSVAFWDNRAAVHRPPEDNRFLGQPRVMHRVMLVGDVPVAPDGWRSESVEGGLYVLEPE